MVRLQLKAKKVYVGLERAAKEVNFQINENKIKKLCYKPEERCKPKSNDSRT